MRMQGVAVLAPPPSSCQGALHGKWLFGLLMDAGTPLAMAARVANSKEGVTPTWGADIQGSATCSAWEPLTAGMPVARTCLSLAARGGCSASTLHCPKRTTGRPNKLVLSQSEAMARRLRMVSCMPQYAERHPNQARRPRICRTSGESAMSPLFEPRYAIEPKLLKTKGERKASPAFSSPARNCACCLATWAVCGNLLPSICAQSPIAKICGCPLTRMLASVRSCAPLAVFAKSKAWMTGTGLTPAHHTSVPYGMTLPDFSRNSEPVASETNS
mmetsp:Transcript_134851/g.336481  ORF Transcript_134851/g.336481 Transcript_134851/m.336481 type:complete len:273 (+) Transcript_134851:509-1327(+)